MTKEEWRFAIKENLISGIHKFGFALLCGATAGVVVSIVLPKFSNQSLAKSDAEIVYNSERTRLEVEAAQKKIDELEKEISILRSGNLEENEK